MKLEELNVKEYWTERYVADHTPWDIGYASPPLTGYFQKLRNRSQRILIPGAGRAHEAKWLWKNGFKNVYVLDIAAPALARLKDLIPDFAQDHLIEQNFFEHRGQYDLIVEQTFFCALAPELRPAYAEKTFELLKPGARLMGVLFDFPLSAEGPPFGGSLDAYRKLFAQRFKIHRLERCYNSIKPRRGKELFLNLIKPA